jgi:hypothetical protein
LDPNKCATSRAAAVCLPKRRVQMPPPCHDQSHGWTRVYM